MGKEALRHPSGGDVTKPKSSKKPADDSAKKGRTLQIHPEPGKSLEAQAAEFAARGIVPMASVLTMYSKDTYSDEVSLTDAYGELMRLSDASTTGDLAHVERLLSAQLLALNSIFAGLAHRSKTNSQAGYLDAADTYMRLALRAQAQCRQTAQTLFEMKNPHPVAFVRQANINNGGQQQVNNGIPPTREESDPEKTELLEASDGEWMDPGTASAPSCADQVLAPVGAIDRTPND